MGSDVDSPERRLLARSSSARSESSLPGCTDRPILKAKRRSKADRDKINKQPLTINDSDDDESGKKLFHAYC